MTESFSIGSSQAVNPGEITPGQAQQMGVTGGQGSFTAAGAGTFIGDASQEGNGRTWQALAGLAKEMLEPHVQRRETELFFDGMQKAIQGQGMQEVIEEQPAWSKVFGRNSVIRGASAVAAMQKVDDFAQLTAGKMTEWRKLPPAQVRKEMLAVFPKMYTGDPMTDAAVQQKMLESVAPLMKQQLKEHLKWQSEEFVKDTAKGLVSSGFDLNLRATELAKEPESPSAQRAFSDAHVTLAKKLAKPDGLDDTLYEKMFLGTYRQMAQTGSFHAVRVMDRMVASVGMDPAKMAAAADFADKQEAQARLSSGTFRFGVGHGKLKAAFTSNTISEKEYVDGVGKLNQEWFTTFGFSKPLISTDEVTRDVASAHGKAYSDVAANRKAEEKAFLALQDQASKDKAVLDSVTEKATKYFSGQRPTDFKLPGETQVMFDAKVSEAFFRGYNNPKDRPAVLAGLVRGANANGGQIPAEVKDYLNNGIRASFGERWTKDFDNSHRMYQEIINTPGATNVIAQIVDPAIVNNMAEYNNLVKMHGMSREAAYHAAFAAPKVREEWTKERKAELTGEIDSKLSPWFSFNAPDYTRAAVADYVTRTSNPLSRHLSGEARTTNSVLSAQRGGLEMVGDFVWSKMKPDDKSFGDIVSPLNENIGREKFGEPGLLSEVFNEVARKKAAEAGIRADLLSVGRRTTGQLDINGFIAYPVPDGATMSPDGKRQDEQKIDMTLFTNDNRAVAITVSSREVREEIKKREDKSTRDVNKKFMEYEADGQRRRYLGITAPETR